MSTHTICGFVGDLTLFGAKTTYLRIKPRSGRIGASVRARERARNRAKDRRNEEEASRPWSRSDHTEIGLISAEIPWSRAEIHNFGRVGKLLLWNLGPDFGRDFWSRFFDRDFLFGDFILFLDQFWPGLSFGRLLPIKGKLEVISKGPN